MTRSSAALVALPLAATLLLAGCGDDRPRPQASPGSGTTTSKPATSSPTTSNSPTTGTTTSGPAADPNIPAAARAHTPAGAEAFVRYYIGLMNWSWTTPKAGRVTAASAPSCESCRDWDRTATELETKAHRYSGAPISIKSLSVTTEAAAAQPKVLASLMQERRQVLDGQGHVVSTDAPGPFKRAFTLSWSSTRWIVLTIKEASA